MDPQVNGLGPGEVEVRIIHIGQRLNESVDGSLGFRLVRDSLPEQFFDGLFGWIIRTFRVVTMSIALSPAGWVTIVGQFDRGVRWRWRRGLMTTASRRDKLLKRGSEDRRYFRYGRVLATSFPNLAVAAGLQLVYHQLLGLRNNVSDECPVNARSGFDLGVRDAESRQTASILNASEFCPVFGCEQDAIDGRGATSGLVNRCSFHSVHEINLRRDRRSAQLFASPLRERDSAVTQR